MGKNGYALVLIGWLTWGWWTLASAFIGLVLSILIVLSVTLIGKYVVLSLPYPVIAIYSIIFEFPASVLNRDLGKRNAKKYNPKREWERNKTRSAYSKNGVSGRVVFWCIYATIAIIAIILSGVLTQDGFNSFIVFTVFLGFAVIFGMASEEY
jgi:hypothetical protein